MWLKRKIKQTATAFLAGFVAVLIVASVALAAYTAVIQVKESSGTDYDMIGITLPFNTNYYVTNGFFNSTGNDTRVKSGTDELPYMMADDRILFAMPLPGSSSQPLDFSTGNSELTDFDLIFGNGGYFTVSDNASMEPSANWTLDFTDIYLNTATTANLTDKPSDNTTAKPNNLHIATGSGNVTTTIGGAIPFGTLTDVSANWTNEANAIDNNIATYASSAGIGIGSTTGNLTTSFPSRTMSNIRYYITASPAATLTMDVQIFYGGGWNGVFSGTVTQGSYQDINFTPQTGVTQMRLNITHSAVGASTEVRLNEIQYWYNASVSQAITAGEHDARVQHEFPFISEGIDTTGNITPVAQNLVMNAALPQTESDNATFTTIDSNGITLTVDGATWTNLGYDFDGTNDNLVANDANLSLTSAFSTGMWFNADNVSAGGYLDNHTHSFGAFQGRSIDINASKIRFDIGNGITNTSVTSNNVITNDTWYFVMATYNGTNIRLYIYDTLQTSTGTLAGPVVYTSNVEYFGAYGPASAPFDGTIGDIYFYDSALTSDQVSQIYNATRLKYLGTGSIATYSTLVSVADNSNSWRFLESGAASYTAQTAYYVDGVLTADFNPVTIITGTTLPDESGNANNGVISWGVNPTGISVTLSSLIASATATATPAIEGPDAFPVGSVPLGVDTPGSPTLGATNPFAVIVSTVTSTTNTPAQLVWWFGAFLVTVIAFVVVWKHTQNQWMSSVAALAAIGVCISMAFIPMWVMYVTAISLIGLATLDRSPAF